MLTSKPTTRSPAVRFLALLALVFILLVLRRPDAVTNPQFWAEDGPVFFVDQITNSGPGILFHPYKDYLLVIPRLLTAFAALFHASAVPLVMNMCALGVAALCCSLFSLNRYRYLLSSDWMRIALCLVMATAFQSDELVGNITCLSFFLLLGALLILLQPPEAYAGAGRLTVAAGLLCGISTASVVILVPLAVGIAIKRRGIASLAPFSVILAAAVQVSVILAGSGTSASGPLSQILGASLIAVAYRVVLASLVGVQTAKSYSASSFMPVLLGTIVTLTVWITSLWWHSKDERRWKVAGSVYLIFASVVLAVSGRSMVNAFSGAGVAEWRGERYFLLGACLFAYLVAVSLERWAPPRKAQIPVLAALFVGGAWGNFHTLPFADLHWREYAPKVDRWISDERSGRAEAVTIPINPAPWRIELPGRVQLGQLEGKLVRRRGAAAEDGKIYVIEKGQRRWVPSPAWMTGHGYGWGDVRLVSAGDLEAIPLGMPVE